MNRCEEIGCNNIPVGTYTDEYGFDLRLCRICIKKKHAKLLQVKTHGPNWWAEAQEKLKEIFKDTEDSNE